jgi:hypothetical protein
MPLPLLVPLLNLFSVRLGLNLATNPPTPGFAKLQSHFLALLLLLLPAQATTQICK